MITQRTQLIMVVLVTIAIATPFTGCSTTGFKKPDFSKLAFWKGKGDMPLPPPPARHFTPADFDGLDEVQMADVKQIDAKSSQSFAESKDQLEISGSRLGETLDLKADSGLASSGRANEDSNNMFDLNLSKIKSSVDQGVAESKNTLASAQENFKSAMASTVDSGKQAASDSLVNLNQSLYDAKGRLVDRSKSTLADSKDSLKVSSDALRNQFDSAAAAAKDFAESSKMSAQDRLADASKSASQMMSQPFPKFGALDSSQVKAAGSNDSGIRDLQAEIAAQKRQIEQLRMQAKNATASGVGEAALAPLQPKSSPLSPMPNQGGFAANSSGGSANWEQPFSPQSALKKATGPLSQLAPAEDSNGSDSSFSPGGALGRLSPIPSSQQGDSAGLATDLPVATRSNSATVYGSLSPEPSSGNQFTPATNAAPKPSSTKPAGSQFPATPYNGFSGGGFSTQNSYPERQVGFEAQASQSDSVVRAGALVPLESNGAGGAGRIGSFVPDEGSSVNGVEIPAVILTGDGSYAPGSVNRLRR